MCAVGRSWCLLVWAGSAIPAATKYTCSAAGTILAPLTSEKETLDTLKADLSLVPDCRVHIGKVAKSVDCKVVAGAVVRFWFTCDPVDGSGDGCQDGTWFEHHARVRVKDLTPLATGIFGPPLTSTKEEWDGEQHPMWKTNLMGGFDVNRTGFNFADVEITWKNGGRPRAGDRIHLHTSISHMSPRDQYDCIGDVDGSGNGASSLSVGTTTTTTTTTTATTTVCRWALKPCGQCSATPVEFCPRDPATENAMLGPVSGMSFDTPRLDTSRLERRLSKKGCVAAASLYPEIEVCHDPECAHRSHEAVMDTGTNISILLKITNHCINKADEDKEAWLVGAAMEDLVDVNVMFDKNNKYISADNAELEPLQRVETHFEQDELQNGWLKLGPGETDKELVRYMATVRLQAGANKDLPVEISARLRDRSIQIMEEIKEAESNDCAKEEGTAWGSTAVTVRTTTSTTTTSTTTSRTTTSSTETSTKTTSTSSTSTRTTSTTTTFTTTTRPCACFEMCCEPEPVQGVHLPVVENVCPEWWQGKMTGRASVNTSGLDSDLEKSLQMKGSASAAKRTADPPSERVVFRKWSGEEDIFRKWSRSKVSSEPAGRSSWIAIGAWLVGSAALLQAVLTLKRRSGVSAQVEMSTGDAGVMDRLVHREETSDRSW